MNRLTKNQTSANGGPTAFKAMPEVVKAYGLPTILEI